MNNRLGTDRSVSVPHHVVNMNLPVSRHRREGGAGVGSPGHVPHWGPEVISVERLAREREREREMVVMMVGGCEADL